MPFIELRWRPRAMITLVHSKWCKTEKKETQPVSNPSRLIRSRTSHFSTKASRKGADALVFVNIARRIHCSSIWIHKVAVYDSNGDILRCSNNRPNWAAGRIRVYTICYIQYGQFHSQTFMAHHVSRLHCTFLKLFHAQGQPGQRQ
jgi:hypothetical protein